MSQGFFSGYVYAAVFLLAGAGFVIATLRMSRLLAPKRVTAEKLTTYESGENPYGQAWSRFPIHFYIFALLFVVFDVEVIFILAWATVFKSLGLLGLAEVAFFIAILGLGLVYAWGKGALKWI